MKKLQKKDLEKIYPSEPDLGFRGTLFEDHRKVAGGAAEEEGDDGETWGSPDPGSGRRR